MANPREKFLKTIHCKNFDTPIFCPAIYDYKANFSNSPIQQFGQDENEFVDAVRKEIKILDPEVVTCGYDIYNVEAEAIGSTIYRDDEHIFPEIIQPLIDRVDQVIDLPLIKKPCGRMKLFIDATKYLNQDYWNRVFIRGAVSGPFTMAGKIYSNEKLMLDCMINPEGVYQLLEYCSEIIITYMKGFIDKGQDIVIFDSLASPPLISSEIYNDLIFPFHQKIFQFMKKRNVEIRSLIIGGNTLPLLDQLTKTGANQLLLDYVIPWKESLNILDRYDMAFRININPALVADVNQDNIHDTILRIISFLGHRPNMMIGTGILLSNTPVENIQFIKKLITEHYRKILK